MLIYSLIATASFTFILYCSIQKGQWLDKLFNWQNKLRNWDINGNIVLFKIGGGCELCFSHLIALISFAIVSAYFVHKDLYFSNYMVIKWFLFYISYVSISTTINLYFITKLFK